MKIPTLLCACACVLLLTGGADARDKAKTAAHKMQRTVKHARPAQPDPMCGERDPAQRADDGAGEEEGQQGRQQHGDCHGDG